MFGLQERQYLGFPFHSRFILVILLNVYLPSLLYKDTYSRIRKSGALTTSVGFNTRCLPCFNELYSLFYLDSIKVVPEDIYNLLTPVALAHWISGDGGPAQGGLILCTDSFTIPECVRLMNVLIINLNCHVLYKFPINDLESILEPVLSLYCELSF